MTGALAVQKSRAKASLATYVPMTCRAFLLSLTLLPGILLGCADPISNGNACFQSSECRDGSVCVETVYGKYCMRQCSADMVRCDDEEACLQASPLEVGTGGTGGAGGAGGNGGTGAEEELWVCLPGRLEDPDYDAREFGTICDYSLDCVVSGVCICIPGATCDGSEGTNGPTCQRICDPNVLNQCPIITVADQQVQLQCTDLGTGRGFCDPTTANIN